MPKHPKDTPTAYPAQVTASEDARIVSRYRWRKAMAHDGTAQLEALLSEGWEPFAVVGVQVHLKRWGV